MFQQLIQQALEFSNEVLLKPFDEEEQKHKENNPKSISASNEQLLPPWVTFSNDKLKTEILQLSKNQHTFSPVESEENSFDLDFHLPLANVILRYDSSLQLKRYKMVPSELSESEFWKRYFFRMKLVLFDITGQHLETFLTENYNKIQQHQEISSKNDMKEDKQDILFENTEVDSTAD